MRRVFNAGLLVSVLFLTLPAQGATLKLLMLGDSLTAGYGLDKGESIPAQLQQALRAEGRDVIVINAGVSGDTSAGGLARLAWSLAENPDAVIVELGANDGLRGLDPAETYRNLDTILRRIRATGTPVLLAGMLAPPNLGREYGDEFNAIYPRLAEEHGIPLYPFFLDGVAAQPELNQDDGIHPNAAGVDVVVRSILEPVRQLLAEVR